MKKEPSDIQYKIDYVRNWCAKSEHCSSDVLQKCRKLKIPETESKILLESLIDEGFIDDARYAKSYIHDKCLFQRWGRLKLIQGLQVKFISHSIIQEAIQQIDPNDYQEALLHAFAKSKQSLPGEPQKWVKSMLQKGFTYEEVYPLLKVIED